MDQNPGSPRNERSKRAIEIGANGVRVYDRGLDFLKNGTQFVYDRNFPQRIPVFSHTSPIDEMNVLPGKSVGILSGRANGINLGAPPYQFPHER